MYPDAAPQSRLAAAPTVAEVTARVASLLAAREAAAVVAKTTDQLFLAVELPTPVAGRPVRAAANAADSPPSTSSSNSPTPSTSSCGGSQDDPRPGPSSEGLCAPANAGSKCWLARNLVCLGTAFMVLYIGMKGAVNLQSSVNAEGGRGNSGLAAYYTGFLFSNFFLPTILIRWVGCKVTVIVAILAYIPYIAAQLFAHYYTLVPGGLLAGLAAGPLWVSQGTYLSHMASVYTAHSGSGSNDVLMARLFGAFYMLYQMSQVWGNLLSSAVLSKGETANVVLNGTMEICGAHFCSSSATSTDHLAQSKPDPHHIAIITFTYLACILVAAAIVYFGVDPIPKPVRARKNSTSGAPTADKTQDMLTRNVVDQWKRSGCEEKNYGACGELHRPTGQAELYSSTSSTSSASTSGGTLDVESILTASNRAIVQSGDEAPPDDSIMAVFSATLRLTTRVDLLLLVPITAFLGAEDSFIAADYTASYVSCAWGIHNIGYVMICFGVMSSTAALVGGSLVKMTGRLPVVLGAAVLQTAVMTAMRLWEPAPNDILLFFAMAGMWGMTDGIWQAQINGKVHR
ncbi:hypothetical protein R5R35_002778 [Gryllus longicercus]|uniref:UNC93-like protein n=1 Tax=Gryllus longicercus TaxID=2509291 RepID=A0AAN9W1H3_9ORTH